MKITTKGRYAVTAMLDLAMYKGKGPVNLQEISSRQCISLSYLEQLFSNLRKQGLIESTRGPGGGYKIGRAVEDISVAEVIRSVDATVDATRCGGSRDCRVEGGCLSHDLWVKLSIQIDDYLSTISLAELLEDRKARQALQQEQKEQVEQPIIPMREFPRGEIN